MASDMAFGRRGAPPPSPQWNGAFARSADPAGNGLVWLLGSYEGRCRRSQYWLGRLGVFACALPALIAIHLVSPSLAAAAADVGSLIASVVLAIMSLAIILASLWALFAIDVKRSHDRGWSGWFSLVGLVPLLNIWAFVELGCRDGETPANQYGPSPKAAMDQLDLETRRRTARREAAAYETAWRGR
jgi:uncharacterized membrane protein YhaH (DUF805 family)